MKPILCQWDGEAFVPVGGYHARQADEDYVIGMRYRLAPIDGRSRSSHNHHFAAIGEAWKSLPERYAAEPWAQSPEHLRKYALIRTGYCSTRIVAAGSNAAALRFAAAARDLDEFALVLVQDATVHIFRAESQAERAMGKERFQQSKDAVLAFIADLLGVEPGALPHQEAA